MTGKLLHLLERFKAPVSGRAIDYLSGPTWRDVRKLFDCGFIVGAVRNVERSTGAVLWLRIESDDGYQQNEMKQDLEHGFASILISDETNTFHGLITARGIEKLYQAHRITFPEALGVWETRERARAGWVTEHPHEYLVVKNVDDSVGEDEHQQASRRWMGGAR
jgi:hypothetical protein